MSVKTLENLFVETLKDIYYAEKKLVGALPKMAKKATSPELKSAIQGHLEETKVHVERIEQIFESMDKRASGKKCLAIEGILDEAEEVTGEIDDKEVLDVAIISSGQTVEHYEIARYGTLAAWASRLGMEEAEDLLNATLEEEKAADAKLSSIAEATVNDRAAA